MKLLVLSSLVCINISYAMMLPAELKSIEVATEKINLINIRINEIVQCLANEVMLFNDLTHKKNFIDQRIGLTSEKDFSYTIASSGENLYNALQVAIAASLSRQYTLKSELFALKMRQLECLN